MLKQSGVLNAKSAALVAVIALMASTSYAEQNLALFGAAARNATAGLTGQRTTDPKTGLSNDLDKKFEEALKLVGVSEKENEGILRNKKWTKKIVAAENDIKKFDQEKLDITEAHRKKNAETLAAVQAMPTGLSATGQTFNTNGYTGGCAPDLSIPRQMTDSGVKELNFFQQTVGKKLNQQEKILAAERLAQLRLARKHEAEKKEAAKKRAEKPQQNIAQLALADKSLIGTPEEELSKRLARVESDGAILKPQMDEKEAQRDAAREALLDFAEKSFSDTAETQRDITPLMSALERFRQSIYNPTLQAMTDAYGFCQQNAKEVLTSNDANKGSKADATIAKEWVNRYYVGPLNAKKKNEFTNAITANSTGLTCVDKTPSFQSLLGKNMKDRIESLKQMSDPQLAAQAASDIVGALNNAIANVGPLLHGRKNSSGQVVEQGVLSACEAVYTKKKAIGKIAKDVKAQADQQSEGLAFGPDRRGGGGRRGVGGQGFGQQNHI